MFRALRCPPFFVSMFAAVALAGGCGATAKDTPRAASVATPEASTTPSGALAAAAVLGDRQGLPEGHPFLEATLALADCDLGPNAKTRPQPSRGPNAIVEICVDDAGWFTERERLGEDGKPVIVTLLRLLHDEDVRVRRAAAFALVFVGGLRYGDRYDDEPELVNALLSAAEAERDPIAGNWMGDLSSNVPSNVPGVLESQQRLVTANPTSELKVTLLSRLFFNQSMLVRRDSSTFRAVVDFVGSAAVDHPDPKVRLVGVSQMLLLDDQFANRACEVWTRALDDSEPLVVDEAMRGTIWRRCSPHSDAVFARIEQRIAQNRTTGKEAELLGSIEVHEKASPDEKKRARALVGSLGDKSP